MFRFLIDWWRSMGIWGWPNLALVAIACWLAVQYEAIPLGWTSHGLRALGDIEVNFQTRGRIEPGKPFEIMLRADKAASMELGFASPAAQQTHAVELPANQNLAMTVIAPTHTGLPLIAVLTDACGDAARWNLGRLYY